jgi:hypothetical protein
MLNSDRAPAQAALDAPEKADNEELRAASDAERAKLQAGIADTRWKTTPRQPQSAPFEAGALAARNEAKLRALEVNLRAARPVMKWTWTSSSGRPATSRRRPC